MSLLVPMAFFVLKVNRALWLSNKNVLTANLKASGRQVIIQACQHLEILVSRKRLSKRELV
jgi:hypothetical protein